MTSDRVKEESGRAACRRLAVTGLLLVLCFSMVAVIGSRAREGYALAREDSLPALRFVLLAFLPFLVACQATFRTSIAAGRKGAMILLGVAVVVRVLLVPVAPFLSDDVYRYAWEGRIQNSGHDPYLLPPDAPELEHLRDEVWENVNHRSISTIYPPLMQVLFRLVAAAGGGVLGMKLFLVTVDLLLVLAVMDLLVALDRNPLRAVFYAWNPLVILEVAGSGHNDPVAILLVVLSVRFLVAVRPAAAVASLTLAGLAKLLPFLLMPFLLFRRVRPRHVLIVPLLAGLLVLPYLDAGSSLGHGAGQYAERWRHNDFLFGGLLRAVGWFLSPDPTFHLRVAKAIAGSMVVLAGAVVVWRRWSPVAIVLVLLGLVVALSPTVHPWYLLWILPWICFRARASWMWLNASVLLSYLGTAPALALAFPELTPLGKEGSRAYEAMIPVLEWGPWLTLLILEAAAGFGRFSRRQRGPESPGPPTATGLPRSRIPPGRGAGRAP